MGETRPELAGEEARSPPGSRDIVAHLESKCQMFGVTAQLAIGICGGLFV